MTDYGKRIKEKLDVVSLTKEDFNQIMKDRLDFGFDSIYFRYAELCDELAFYKVKVEHSDPVKEHRNMGWRKMHFYKALEQLLHAHEEEKQEHDSNSKPM